MKKLFSILLIFVLTISLCACSKNENADTSRHGEVIEHHTTIPVGAKFETSTGTELPEGSVFPSELQVGDSYMYKDYIYRYGMSFKIAQD